MGNVCFTEKALRVLVFSPARMVTFFIKPRWFHGCRGYLSYLKSFSAFGPLIFAIVFCRFIAGGQCAMRNTIVRLYIRAIGLTLVDPVQKVLFCQQVQPGWMGKTAHCGFVGRTQFTFFPGKPFNRLPFVSVTKRPG
jgi:hypothetical protein